LAFYFHIEIYSISSENKQYKIGQVNVCGQIVGIFNVKLDGT